MKLKLLTLLLFVLPALSFAQVSLNASMAPSIGSRIIYYDANVPSPPFTFSKTGSGNTWDFSTITITPGQEDTTYIVDPASIPGGSAFPTATHCSYEGEANPTYTMLKVESSGATLLGVVADPIGSGNYFSLVMVPPVQAITFPYTTGSSASTSAYATVTVTGATVGQPSIDSVRFKTTSVSDRDIIATGTMVLPSGSLPAMLERNIKSKVDTAWGKSALSGNQYVVVSTDAETDSAFHWYTNESLEPYAHALFDNTGLHDVTYFKGLVTANVEPKRAEAGHAYPNPVSDVLQLPLAPNAGSYDLTIVNAQGQMVMHGSATLSQLNVSYLQSGIYTLTLTAADGKTTTTRFVKN